MGVLRQGDGAPHAAFRRRPDMRRGTGFWKGTAAAAALLIAAVAVPAADDNPPVGGPTHGAMPMDQQLARIGQLLPETNVSEPPAGVDPVIFKLFIPKDNE